MNSNTYKNKTQNMFTAYVSKTLEGTRLKYLSKKNKYKVQESYLEDSSWQEPMQYFEEYYDTKEKEHFFTEEMKGNYPKWEELSDDNVRKAVLLLNDEERELIYRHVFEERSLKEISAQMGESCAKLENRYYYAIKKMRKWIGDDRNGF